MTLQELIAELQTHEQYESQHVYIHDPSTGDDVPVGKIETEYEGRRVNVVIHAEEATTT